MKIFSLLLFLLVSTLAVAQQDYSDAIYLNDGSILKGKIIERLDDGAIKMRMNNGREIIVSMKEVKLVNIGGLGTNVTDYGGTKAVGISLFGEGGIGLHYRFKTGIETWGDVSIQPDFVGLENQYTDKVKLSSGFGLGGEINHYLSRRFKESKQKVRANGIFFRVYHGFNAFSSTVISAGWSSEYFKLNRFKRGFLLTLGPALKINHWADDPLNVAYTEFTSVVEPSAVLRIQWNFFK